MPTFKKQMINNLASETIIFTARDAVVSSLHTVYDAFDCALLKMIPFN